MNARIEYVRLYPSRFFGGTVFMSGRQRCIYAYLLFWQAEKGAVPNDANAIASHLGMPADDVAAVLEEKFEPESDGPGLVNRVMDAERSRCIQAIEAQRERAEAARAARAAKSGRRNPLGTGTDYTSTGTEEKEKEKEKEKDSEVNANASVDFNSDIRDHSGAAQQLEELKSEWNSLPKERFAQIRTLSYGRQQAAFARFCEADFRENWRTAIARLAERCTWPRKPLTIDWFLSPDTLTRILEGEFDDRANYSGNGHATHPKSISDYRTKIWEGEKLLAKLREDIENHRGDVPDKKRRARELREKIRQWQERLTA